MKKSILTLAAIVLIAVSAIIFIRQSNDHKECTITEQTVKHDDGTIVTTKKHSCNEKYNL